MSRAQQGSLAINGTYYVCSMGQSLLKISPQ